jgi:hypothetical protein
MKILWIVLTVLLSIFTWTRSGSADRLHHWVDSKGVAHISKEPPPADGKLVEIMEYSVSKNNPAQTDQVESAKAPEKQNGNGAGEKLQATGAQQKPKDDLQKACYILCDLDDVHVYVFEFTNPDQVLERTLYRGNIPKGHKQIIQSSSGKIQYSYRRSSADRTYGDNRAECVKGHVISIR